MMVLGLFMFVGVALGASDDYYDILGVPRDASPALIRRAYRRKAAKLHPDRNPNNEKAKKEFLALGQAYQVLTDPEKRKEYDNFGKEYVEQKERGGGGGGGGHGHPFGGGGGFFDQFFGGGGGGHGGGFRFEFNQGDDDWFGGGGGGHGGWGGGGGFGGYGQQEEDLFTEQDSPVTLLTAKSYKKKVLGSHEPWLIMYFSNDCHHCHEFANAYEKVAKKLKNLVNVGAVDCQTSGSACRHIEGYPEIHLFNGEEDEHDKRDPADGIHYRGRREAKKLINWVMKHLVSNVNQIFAFEDFEKEYIKGKDFLKLPTCILFSDKLNVPPIFDALSRNFARDFDFVFVSVNKKTQELKKVFDLLNIKDRKVPQLVINNFVVKSRMEIMSQKSELTFEKISEKLTAYALAMNQIKKFGVRKEIHEDSTLHLLKASNYDNLCPESASFLCVIGVRLSAADKEIFNKLSARFVKDRFRFMYYETSSEASEFYDKLEKAAEISNGIVILNRKKSKVVVKDGIKDEAGARTFLESVLSGSGRFKIVEL